MFRHFRFALPFLCTATLLAADPPAQLLLPSRVLAPESTFELRFASEMVRPEQIGKPAEVSPLLFDPPIAGRFVWLSTRSGSFAPEGILPLATKFKISLRPGTKDASGKIVPPALRETAETPPFRVKGESVIGYIDKDNATVFPRFLILFNANVNAASAAKYCRFVNGAGRRIEARVEQADDPQKRERKFPDLAERRSLARGLGSETGGGRAGRERRFRFQRNRRRHPPSRKPRRARATSSTSRQPNHSRPGPPGVSCSMPACPRRKAKSPCPRGGKSRSAPSNPSAPPPCARKAIAPMAGASSSISTSRSPAKCTSEEISKWLKLDPVPANLKIVIQESGVTMKGDFALGASYRVSVAAGLPAREPVTMTAPFSAEARFEPIPPRLYFQDFAAPQLSGGTRQLRLLAVNVPRVHVTATTLHRRCHSRRGQSLRQIRADRRRASLDESYSRLDAR